MASKRTSTPSQILSTLYFGKDDAESDSTAGGLLKQGFLRTAAYDAAQKGQKALIIGRKGSGKSAICYMLKSSSPNGAQVSLVTPDEISSDEIRKFELPGIPREQSKMLIWRYVFAIQIAKYALSLGAVHLQTKRGLPKELSAIRKFLIDNGEVTELPFHERFWRIIERIKASISLEAFGVKLSGEVATPSDGIRASTQLDLVEENIRRALDVLPAKARKQGLLLLVDQLEKVWSNDRDSDLMVVGLLLASKHVSANFGDVKCIVFLRTDIYELLQFQDRDKFRGDEMHIDWKPDRLLDLVLARAQASVQISLKSEELWGTVFAKHVNEESITSFIVQRTLMRPRDIIQLCNACRDAAQKNGHSVIEESDINEAVNLYSNWKLSDLINEYRVNYPFLSDLLVLFGNSSYLISRRMLDKKFSTVRETLITRYPDVSNAFSLDAVLAVLYNIGFLGVIRDGVSTYVYADPNTIERNEIQYLIHPCFRAALKSTSSVDVVQYEASDAAEDIAIGRSPRRAATWLFRGSRPSRSARYLIDSCQRIEAASIESSLPAEVRAELRRNLSAVMTDAETMAYMDSPVQEYATLQKVLRFFSQLSDKLKASAFFDDESNRSLRFALERAIAELARGSGPEDFLEHS